jgi:hypothetical protein
MLVAGAAGTVTARLADRFGRLPGSPRLLRRHRPRAAGIVLTGLPWVFAPIALTGFALNQSFSSLWRFR